MEDRVDLVNETNKKYHSNAQKWGLRFPKGTMFAEDLSIDPALMRLDKESYISSGRLQDEIAAVWKKTWQFACRAESIKTPGDYFVYDMADQSYLILRQQDGSIKAFHNACRHRGNRLADGRGNMKDIACPFHRWTWKIDGSVRAIPDLHTFCQFSSKDDVPLVEVPCDSWGGFVFINPDSETQQSLVEFLGPVAEQLAAYRFEDMVTFLNMQMPLSANWKTTVDAFIELYHVQGVHPQFLVSSDDYNAGFEILSDESHSRVIIPFGLPSQRLSSWTNEDIVKAFLHPGGLMAGATLDLEGADLDGELRAREFLLEELEKVYAKRGTPLEGLGRDQYIDDWHYFIFPGLVLNITAGGALVIMIRPDMSDPDKCSIQTMLIRMPVDEEREAAEAGCHVTHVEEGRITYGEILDQDYSNVVLTQKGMHSDSVDELLLSAQEYRIAVFHKRIRDMIAARG